MSFLTDLLTQSIMNAVQPKAKTKADCLREIENLTNQLNAAQSQVTVAKAQLIGTTGPGKQNRQMALERAKGQVEILKSKIAAKKAELKTLKQ